MSLVNNMFEGRNQIIKKYYTKIFSVILIIFLILIAVRFLVISPGRISGNSMEPNFHDKEGVFINKVIYLLQKPQRFDVVELVEPQTDKIMIKRIISLPNEIVTIKGGEVFLQEKQGADLIPVAEPYLPAGRQNTAEKEIVSALGPNSYYVLGDKRDASTDSRIYGPVDRQGILGKIIEF